MLGSTVLFYSVWHLHICCLVSVLVQMCWCLGAQQNCLVQVCCLQLALLRVLWLLFLSRLSLHGLREQLVLLLLCCSSSLILWRLGKFDLFSSLLVLFLFP